jgi:hypothetical protein
MHLQKTIHRSGSTLLELVLFVSFFAVASSAVLVLLFGINEQRRRQEGIARVDQTGVQLVQTIVRRVRAAERVLDPPLGASGTILAMQMAAQINNPTILTVQSGAIIAAEYDAVVNLSTIDDFVVSNFQVHNTSPQVDRPSIAVSFRIVATLNIPSQPTYSRTFETVVSLFPDDQQQGNSCGCSAPSCTGGYYRWQYCSGTTCTDGPLSVLCE